MIDVIYFIVVKDEYTFFFNMITLYVHLNNYQTTQQMCQR